MKAMIWTLAALSGAACLLAGVEAQPPALRGGTLPPPSSDLPGDEPSVAKPIKPLTINPQALRKKDGVEPEKSGPLDDVDVPAPSKPKAALPVDDPTRPMPRRFVDEAPVAVPPRTPGKMKPKLVVPKHEADDEEPLPGTASVRRARSQSKSPAMDLQAPVSDGSRRVDQVVSLEWVCPANIKAKQPFTCEMIVRNNGVESAQNVVVHNPSPEGYKIVSADPKPTTEGEMMKWSFGTLGPKQERRIKLEMSAERRGELSCKAAVSAMTPSSTRFKVTEPQLVVKQESPDKVMVGDAVPVTITISNPGDGPTEPVVVRAKMSDGLRGEKGQEMVNEVGVLAAGESRVLKLVCQSIKGGSHKIVTTAIADGGLRSASESSTMISEPKVEVALSGPKLRYLDRAAVYTVTISNPGDAAANDVRVSAAVPVGFKVGTPSNNGKFDLSTRTISWTIGTLSPGDKKEVTYKCSATQIGEHKHMASAEASRGLRGSSDLVTKVEGIASLLMELADVDDPIEVGAETAYEVRITNHGSAPAANVEIRALVPKAMSIKGCQGPTEYKIEGQEVVFTGIPKLAPKADAVYRIMVKANAVGDVRFRARLASDSLSEPVIGEEGTKIYSDGKN